MTATGSSPFSIASATSPTRWSRRSEPLCPFTVPSLEEDGEVLVPEGRMVEQDQPAAELEAFVGVDEHVVALAGQQLVLRRREPAAVDQQVRGAEELAPPAHGHPHVADKA